MLTDALVVIDTLVALGLIVVILLHSGRGGGLSDMFGASTGSSAAGSTVAERNLDRITVAFVLIFTFVTVALSLRWSG
ncbi:MAG: preprotein translocase subunit SecG [Acidimicrobiales bacterium]